VTLTDQVGQPAAGALPAVFDSLRATGEYRFRGFLLRDQ